MHERCRGQADCFIGIVIGIVDGDTYEINSEWKQLDITGSAVDPNPTDVKHRRTELAESNWIKFGLRYSACYPQYLIYLEGNIKGVINIVNPIATIMR
jgi:hypothetical protein